MFGTEVLLWDKILSVHSKLLSVLMGPEDFSSDSSHDIQDILANSNLDGILVLQPKLLYVKSMKTR